jgi:hypothetical protein
LKFLTSFHSFFTTLAILVSTGSALAPTPKFASSFLHASFAVPLLFRQQQAFFWHFDGGAVTCVLSDPRLRVAGTTQHSWIPPPPFDSPVTPLTGAFPRHRVRQETRRHLDPDKQTDLLSYPATRLSIRSHHILDGFQATAVLPLQLALST